MSQMSHEYPEDYEERIEAMLDAGDRLRKERKEAEFFHDQEPGRWGDHASPARMRRDVERDREEDEQRRP